MRYNRIEAKVSASFIKKTVVYMYTILIVLNSKFRLRI